MRLRRTRRRRRTRNRRRRRSNRRRTPNRASYRRSRRVAAACPDGRRDRPVLDVHTREVEVFRIARGYDPQDAEMPIFGIGRCGRSDVLHYLSEGRRARGRPQAHCAGREVDVVCKIEPSARGERRAPLLDGRHHPL